MTTPNITSGVTERVKPVRLGSPVGWRFEGSLGAGATITTPIFDHVPDGQPFSQAEVAAATGAVVRVPSKYCVITHQHTGDNIGARLQVFHLADGAGQLSPCTLYAQGGSSGRFNRWLYELCGRRCQFRLQNTPLGTATGVAGTQFFELVWESIGA